MKKEDVLRTYVYHCETGTFDWKNPGIRRKPGHASKAGYLRLIVDHQYYPAHHLVWLIERGQLPDQQIDHIDGDRSNNRIGNLRQVSPVVNSQNQRKAHRTSSTGLLGASPAYKSWRAQIKVYGRNIHLGMFKSPEEAHAAYVRAKRVLHRGCTI